MKKLFIIMGLLIFAFNLYAAHNDPVAKTATLTSEIIVPVELSVGIQGAGLFTVVKGDIRTEWTSPTDNIWNFGFTGEVGKQMLLTFHSPTCATTGAPTISGDWYDAGVPDVKITSSSKTYTLAADGFDVFYQLDEIDATAATVAVATPYVFSMSIDYEYTGL